jgi:Carboxypeptidase regulatory-like domain
MARQFRYVGIIAAALIGLPLVSCGSDSENRGAPTAPSGNVSSAPVQRIEVSAPDSIPPGESAQLAATAIKTDGSTENVSASATWSSSTTRVIQIAAGGRATAVGVGEAVVTARFQSRGGSRLVLSLPTGTYKVSGRITEGSLALPGVSLRVTRGTGEGLTTTSDSSGRFSLYGLAGDVRIQASKAGYLDAFRDLSVGSTLTDNFELAPARQRKNLAGTYTMTLGAPTCSNSSPFPDELRSRTYIATVTQQAQVLNVALSGADFIVTSGRGDHFSGAIDPLDNVTFTLGNPFYYYYYYYYASNPFDLVERIDDSRSFSVAGFVNATMRGSEIIGSLSGGFIVLRGSRPPFTQILSTCSSSSHTFAMRLR